MTIARSSQSGSAARIDLSRTFIRRTDFSGASLVATNLSYADCTNTNFRGADFKDAILGRNNSERRRFIWGAQSDERARCRRAIIDERTVLPKGLR